MSEQITVYRGATYRAEPAPDQSCAICEFGKGRRCTRPVDFPEPCLACSRDSGDDIAWVKAEEVAA